LPSLSSKLGTLSVYLCLLEDQERKDEFESIRV
jgi:hypothetical protein